MINRIVWMVSQGELVQSYHLHEAMTSFYFKYPNVRPTSVRMVFMDYSNYCRSLPLQSQNVHLEKGKQYGNYIITPYGPVPIEIMDDSDIGNWNQTNNSGQALGSVFFVESDEVDREFEKHILNTETKS